MNTLLVIDDEPNLRYSIERTLASPTLCVLPAETAPRGIAMIRTAPPDVVLLDVRLPDMSGLDALREIRKVDARLPVILITAHGTTATAIESMKRGAFDYLVKPFDLRQLREVVAKAIESGRMARVPAMFDEASAPDAEGDFIVGRSPAMQEVYKAIGRVAPTEVSVLLLGESGTGKELVARAIYQHSCRSGQIFLPINCAAIPETLLESELFGHERGAFSGAERQRIGKFEQCNGGTIFLDEISDMSPSTQAKVLRLLQDQRFERVGGNETIQTNVRVIAATNRNLARMAADGRFRPDLYYRLKTYTIELPPLRERVDDLPLLAEHLVRRHNTDAGKQVQRVAPETITLLERSPWPGNVRELQGVIKSALINATSDVLTPDCLPPEFAVRGCEPSRSLAGGLEQLGIAALVRAMLEANEPEIYRKLQAVVDRVILAEVLREVGNNQVEAARRLGISRSTLRSKLQTLSNSSVDTGSPQ